jgi:hypothetical protein
MEPKQENTQPNNSGAANPAGMNIPEWVMHLLTGMGTMGAEYMLFIKPLQEKMDLQRLLLEQQNERIKRLENALKNKGIKLKSYSNESDDDDEDEDTELFQVRRKPATESKHRKYSQVKF